MPNSSKPTSTADANQTLQNTYNESDKTFSTSGYVTSKVGAKITRTAVSGVIDDFRFLDVVQTQNGTTVNTSPVITGLPRTNFLLVGMYVIGTGIPANTKILSVDSNSQITLDANATANATVSLQFANLLYKLRITYDTVTHDNVDIAERVE